jgi:hypothetical protein
VGLPIAGVVKVLLLCVYSLITTKSLVKLFVILVSNQVANACQHPLPHLQTPQSAPPKEEALCEQFGVSRITVRRALGDLAAQGLVLRRHGLGTFVQPGGAAPRQGATLGFLDGLRKVATETQVQVLDLQRLVPPANIAALLQLPEGESAVHALRLRSAGDVPLMLTDAWIPARLGKRVTRVALEKKAMYELLMSQGIRFGRVVQEIGAESGPGCCTPKPAHRFSGWFACCMTSTPSRCSTLWCI